MKRYIHFAKGTCSVLVPDGAATIKGGGEYSQVVFLDSEGRAFDAYVSRCRPFEEILVRRLDPNDEELKYTLSLPSTPIAASPIDGVFGAATFQEDAFPSNRYP